MAAGGAPEVPTKTARLVIEGVTPQVDGGRFAAKGSLGEPILVEADVFLDGHDQPAVRLLHRALGEKAWTAVRMRPLGNDRFRAEFTPRELGCHLFTVEAWIDTFATWAGDLARRVDASQEVAVDLLIGAQLVKLAAARSKGPASDHLTRFAQDLEEPLAAGAGQTPAIEVALSSALRDAMDAAPDLSDALRLPGDPRKNRGDFC